MYRYFSVFVVWLVTILGVTISTATVSTAMVSTAMVQETIEQTKDRIEVKHDNEKNETEVLLRSDDGTFTWLEIAKAIVTYAEPEADLIEIPKEKQDGQALDLNSWKSRLGLRLTDITLGDGIDFRIQENRRALLIRIQHKFVGSRLDAIKSRLRSFVLGNDESWKEQYKIKFAERDLFPKPKVPLKKNQLCLFIHGLNSSSEIMQPLAAKVHGLGYRIAFFDYPNDDRIRNSAALLSDELKKLKQQQKDLKVTIIAHSMGGLVARKTIESQRYDPKNVKSVCLICTPSHGSKLARYAMGIDLVEHFFSRKDSESKLSRFKSSFADGLNGAARDLRPDSDFLKRLNDGQRNQQVNYRLFIGTKGVIPRPTQASLQAAQLAVNKSLVDRILSIPKKKLHEYEEVVDGKGDGVVSVKSATLPGVTDINKFEVTHSSMWTHPDHSESKKLFDTLLKTLD